MSKVSDTNSDAFKYLTSDKGKKSAKSRADFVDKQIHSIIELRKKIDAVEQQGGEKIQRIVFSPPGENGVKFTFYVNELDLYTEGCLALSAELRAGKKRERIVFNYYPKEFGDYIANFVESVGSAFGLDGNDIDFGKTYVKKAGRRPKDSKKKRSQKEDSACVEQEQNYIIDETKLPKDCDVTGEDKEFYIIRDDVVKIAIHLLNTVVKSMTGTKTKKGFFREHYEQLDSMKDEIFDISDKGKFVLKQDVNGRKLEDFRKFLSENTNTVEVVSLKGFADLLDKHEVRCDYKFIFTITSAFSYGRADSSVTEHLMDMFKNKKPGKETYDDKIRKVRDEVKTFIASTNIESDVTLSEFKDNVAGIKSRTGITISNYNKKFSTLKTKANDALSDKKKKK